MVQVVDLEVVLAKRIEGAGEWVRGERTNELGLLP